MHWFSFLRVCISFQFIISNFQLLSLSLNSLSLSLLTHLPSPFSFFSQLIFSLLTLFSFSFCLLSLPSVCLLRIVGTLFAWHWPQDTSGSGSISPSALALMGSPRGPCKEAPCSPHNPAFNCRAAPRLQGGLSFRISQQRNFNFFPSTPGTRGLRFQPARSASTD